MVLDSATPSTRRRLGRETIVEGVMLHYDKSRLCRLARKGAMANRDRLRWEGGRGIACLLKRSKETTLFSLKVLIIHLEEKEKSRPNKVIRNRPEIPFTADVCVWNSRQRARTRDCEPRTDCIVRGRRWCSRAAGQKFSCLFRRPC